MEKRMDLFTTGYCQKGSFPRCCLRLFGSTRKFCSPFAACSIQFRKNRSGKEEEASVRLEPTASPLLILLAELSGSFLLSFSFGTCLHRDTRQISSSPDKKERRHRASAFGSESGRKKRTISWLQMQWRWWLRVWRYGCPPRTANTAVTETVEVPTRTPCGGPSIDSRPAL